MLSFMESRRHALFLAQSAVLSVPLCQWLLNWSLWFCSASMWAQTVPSSWGTSSQKQTLKRKRTLKCYRSLYESGAGWIPFHLRSRFSIRWNGEKLPTVGKIRTVWCPTPPLTHALPQTGSEHMSMAQRAISSQTPVLHHESGTIESGREECGCQSPTAEIWILGLPVPGCRQLTSYSSFWTLVTSSEIENNSTIYLTGKNRWDNLWNMLNVLSGT